jgi:4Fe-4S single cluster domain
MRELPEDSSHAALLEQHKGSITPKSLIVLTTNQCTATCGHCCMNSSAKRRERIDHGLMLRAISSFKTLYDIKLVVFAGGEPTLLKGSLLAAIAHCRQQHIVTRLVTNVSWAINEAKADEGFRALFAAGLNDVNISCDDYHDPFIPFERVKIAWKSARKLAFNSIIIANASHKGSRLTPQYIESELGEELPLRFDDDGSEGSIPAPDSRTGTIIGMSNARLQRLGRATDSFVEDDLETHQSDLVMSQSCPNAIKMPALTPEGSVVACCGFELAGNPVLDFGSLKSQDVGSLIESANDNIIAAVISRLGPGFLVKFANKISPGIIPPKKYAGICEACQDVVQNHDVLRLLFEHRARLAALVHILDGKTSTVAAS